MRDSILRSQNTPNGARRGRASWLLHAASRLKVASLSRFQEPITPSRRRRTKSLATSVSIGVSVGFSVLLISVSYGVSHNIDARLSGSGIRQSGLIDVGRINAILALLTVVVTGAMLVQTAATTFVLGVTMMQAQRETIAIRRQSGVLRAKLMGEFTNDVLRACLIGGVAGEVIGVAAAYLIGHHTVLPVRFTWVSVLAAFPVTVTLALVATLIPAWQAANTSPALLRKE